MLHRFNAPDHILITIDDGSVEHIDKAVYLVLWCMILGTHRISIQDRAGILAQHGGAIANLMYSQLKSWLEEDYDTWPVVFEVGRRRIPLHTARTAGSASFSRFMTEESDMSQSLDDTLDNGNAPWAKDTEEGSDSQSFETFRVRFLWSSQGRLELVDAARRICEEVQLGKYSYTEVDEKLVGNHLPSLNNLWKEPDLVLRCGSTGNLENIQPWLVRYASIYHIPSLKDVSFHQFTGIIQQFSGVEQRHGK